MTRSQRKRTIQAIVTSPQIGDTFGTPNDYYRIAQRRGFTRHGRPTYSLQHVRNGVTCWGPPAVTPTEIADLAKGSTFAYRAE